RSSVSCCPRSRAPPTGVARGRNQAGGTPEIIPGWPAPEGASKKKSRRGARQFSIGRRGSPPPPAMIPTLPAIGLFWLANGAARIGPDEVDDGVYRSDAAETLGGLVHPLAECALRGEKMLIGIAQALDLLTGGAVAARDRA